MAEFDWSKYEDQDEVTPSKPSKEFDWSAYEDKPTTIKEDLVNILRRLPDNVMQTLMALPSQAYESGKQVVTHPIRAAENIAAGGLEAAKGAYNLPLNIASYLGKKDVGPTHYFRDFAGPLAERLKIGETGLQQKVLGQPQQGDALLQSLSSFAPYGAAFNAAKSMPLVARNMLAGEAWAAGQNEDPLTAGVISSLAPMGGKALKKAYQRAELGDTIEQLQGDLSKAEDTAMQQEGEFELAKERKAAKTPEQQFSEALKKTLSEQYAERTPEAFQRSINKMTDEVGALDEAASIPFEDLENRLPPPAGETLQEQANSRVEQITKHLQQILNKGQTHDIVLKRGILDRVDRNKKAIQADWKKFEDDISKKNVAIPRENLLQDAQREVAELLKKSGGTEDPLFDYYVNMLMKEENKRPPVDIIPAQDLIRENKKTREALTEARGRAFEEGGKNQTTWQERYNKLNELAKQQEQTIEKYLPDEYEKLKKLKKRWADDVAAVYGHKVYRDAKFHNQINAENIIKALRTDSKGGALLRSFVKENPILNTAVLGKNFAENPHKLLNADENEQQYIDNSRSIQSAVNALREALNAQERATVEANRQRSEAKEIAKNYSEAKSQQEIRTKAIAERESLKQEIKKKEQARDKLRDAIEKEVKSIKENEAYYKQAIKAKAEANKKVDDLKKELNKLQKDINKKNERLKKIIIGLTTLGIYGGASKLLALLKKTV